jgi:hypothetical protein
MRNHKDSTPIASDCDSFSNSLELAARDIKTFSEKYQGAFTHSALIDFFEKSSDQTGSEYLLTLLGPLRVFKIAEGSASKTIAHQAWIGDYEAFRRFREYQSNKRKGLDIWEQLIWPSFGEDAATNNAFSKLVSDFKLTLGDPDILSAGDFYTVITNIGSEFRFLLSSQLYYDSLGEFPITPKLGESFDYRFSVLVPKENGINACAFYYPHARSGHIFYSTRPYTVADLCTICRDATLESFAKSCESIVGVEFDYVTTSHTRP